MTQPKDYCVIASQIEASIGLPPRWKPVQGALSTDPMCPIDMELTLNVQGLTRQLAIHFGDDGTAQGYWLGGGAHQWWIYRLEDDTEAVVHFNGSPHAMGHGVEIKDLNTNSWRDALCTILSQICS